MPADCEPGDVIVVRSERGFELKQDSLERRQSGIELLSVKVEDGVTIANVFVPRGKYVKLLALIDDYEKKVSPKKGQPKNRELIESIASIKLAAVRDLWQDTLPFPGETENLWWEMWLRMDADDPIAIHRRFADLATAAGMRVSDQFVHFPECVVTQAFGNQRQFSQSLDLLAMVAELRKAKELATAYAELAPRDQAEFIREAVSRLVPPPSDAPAVCILDSGVNREHPLLAPALALADTQSIKPAEWGTADDHRQHGTEMAGIALYGNLTNVFESNLPVTLRHRLESVKFLPPTPAQNDPKDYAPFTIQALARAEIQAPQRNRAVCMAVTADDRDLGMPTLWSGAVDQLCAGAEDETPRLMFISVGNLRQEILAPEYEYHRWNCERGGIEDPAQAWNALSVGQDSANRSGCDDLSLLTTVFPPPPLRGRLLDTTRDTSPATAAASRMGAIIWSHYPKLWPETVRGLIIHSARWTPRMIMRFPAINKASVQRRLRCYGYGVPDLRRALWSAENAATLIFEGVLQPYKKEDGVVHTNEMHVHRLPWPVAVLQQLGETPVTLRVTLSYFIEPSPGRIGWTRKHRYQSHGLRFEVNRPTENEEAFRQRLSRAEWEEDQRPDNAPESRDWVIGDRGRRRGSLHNDAWTGPAADLATSNMIGIYPVTGWWRERPHLGHVDKKARYSLIVSIEAPGVEVDLYTPITTQAAISTEIAV